MYRSLFRGRSRSPLNLLQGLGQYRRHQCCGYASASGYNNRKAKGQQLLTERTSSSSSSSSLIFYAVPAVALLGIVGVAASIRYNDERRATLKGQGKSRSANVEGPKIGGPFTLINTEGKIVTEGNLLGNWVLLYFGYTSSPDVGPAEVKKMVEAIGKLESKQNAMVLPVFVTLDPQRDSPSQLRAYLSEFDSRIVGLTGPIAAIRQMAQEYRVFFKKVEEDGNDYLVETSHNMYLMNPNMEVVRSFGLEYNAKELSDAIIKEMGRAT